MHFEGTRPRMLAQRSISPPFGGSNSPSKCMWHGEGRTVLQYDFHLIL